MAVAYSLNEEVWRARWTDGPAARDVLVQALGTIDPAPVLRWADPLAFLEPMELSISNAMYWQEPHQEDALAAYPDVVAALRPIADAVTNAPAAAWWSTPVDLATMRYTSMGDEHNPPSPPALVGTRERLSNWRVDVAAEERRAASERTADLSAPISGHWWSTPAMATLVTTTRPLPSLGSIELVWQEDSLDQDSAAIWPMTSTRPPQVWEIGQPKDWVRLVDRYPLETTMARRHDWYRTTGHIGAWRIPDWDAVASDWDAVHLSVAGYLTTATRAIRLDDGDAATVLAG